MPYTVYTVFTAGIIRYVRRMYTVLDNSILIPLYTQPLYTQPLYTQPLYTQKVTSNSYSHGSDALAGHGTHHLP
jgi:hypothetical protein